MNYTWIGIGVLIVVTLMIKSRMDSNDRWREASKLSPERLKAPEVAANKEFARTNSFEYNQGYRVTLDVYGNVTGAERGWKVPGFDGEPW